MPRSSVLPILLAFALFGCFLVSAEEAAKSGSEKEGPGSTTNPTERELTIATWPSSPRLPDGRTKKEQLRDEVISILEKSSDPGKLFCSLGFLKYLDMDSEEALLLLWRTGQRLGLLVADIDEVPEERQDLARAFHEAVEGYMDRSPYFASPKIVTAEETHADGTIRQVKLIDNVIVAERVIRGRPWRQRAEAAEPKAVPADSEYARSRPSDSPPMTYPTPAPLPDTGKAEPVDCPPGTVPATFVPLPNSSASTETKAPRCLPPEAEPIDHRQKLDRLLLTRMDEAKTPSEFYLAFAILTAIEHEVSMPALEAYIRNAFRLDLFKDSPQLADTTEPGFALKQLEQVLEHAANNRTPEPATLPSAHYLAAAAMVTGARVSPQPASGDESLIGELQTLLKEADSLDTLAGLVELCQELPGAEHLRGDVLRAAGRLKVFELVGQTQKDYPITWGKEQCAAWKVFGQMQPFMKRNGQAPPPPPVGSLK